MEYADYSEVGARPRPPVHAAAPVSEAGTQESILDSLPATPAPQTLPHPSLYFEDGDIALAARESDMLTYVFRVHRLFLRHHSPGLRDLIATMVDGQAAEEYEGVPLLRMPEEDMAENVAGLLEIIYDISTLSRRLGDDRRADTPLRIEGLLNICETYKLLNVASVIKEHVRQEWPTTLAGWEVRQMELQGRATHETLPEPVSAIQFATEHDIPSVLPAAFYHLSVLSSERDWHDTPDAALNPTNTLAARWYSLDDYNAVRFIKGRDAMLKYYFAHFADNMTPAVLYTGRWDTGCVCNFDLLQREVRLTGVSQHLDCLHELKRLIERCNHDHGFCLTCVTRVRSNFTRLRVDIWNRLPEFFGVQPGANRLTWGV